MAFALVASMAFVKVPEFNGFYPTVIYLFGVSFGDFELTLFDEVYDSPAQRYIGQAFLLVFIFVNLLLLLNMVVAIMADTYAAMTATTKGIYNHSILSTLPQFRMSKTYGGLISSIPGLNIINFLISPAYLLIRDRETLRSLTSALAIMNYMFVLIPLTAVFIALNALLIPFAYLRTLKNKFNRCRKRRNSTLEPLKWILFGLPLILSY